MNVASKELCQELYELSGWKDTGESHLLPDPSSKLGVKKLPAYSLGYLLRKLPTDRSVSFRFNYKTDEWWVNEDRTHLFFTADTPEDAATKLAIELFKQGILKADN